MKRTFQVLESASLQIDDIYNYTYEKFGAEQASKYLDGLFGMFEAIAYDKARSSTIQAEYKVYGRYTRYEKHFIYWKIMDDGNVGIAEVLHERMNLGDRLALSGHFTEMKIDPETE